MTQNQHDSKRTWLKEHFDVARSTDQLRDRDRYADILALGLVGKVGSVLAALKKVKREQEAYPLHRQRLTEELGDALWYLLRIVDIFDCGMATLDSLCESRPNGIWSNLDDAVELGLAAGELLRVTRQPSTAVSAQPAVVRVAAALSNVGAGAGVMWPNVAKCNRKKILSRWPQTRDDTPICEHTDLEEEQFPDRICVEFRMVAAGKRNVVILRCRGLNLGDRLPMQCTWGGLPFCAAS